MLDTHNYPPPVAVAPTLTRASVSGEYGAIQTRSAAANEWCPACAPTSSPAENLPDYASATQRYQQHNATLRALMTNPGLSAGVYCCTTDVETEYDGILTYDRRVDKMTRSTVKAENDALIAASRTLNAPPVTTLNGLWKFDEGSGTSALDSSGNGRTATFWQNPAWTSGQLGGGIALNGNNDITVPANTIDTSQSFTASAWVKLGRSDGWNTAVAADGSNVSSFMLHYGGPLGNKFAMSLMQSDSTSTAVTRALSTTSPAVGTWYRITGVYNQSANTIALYVNGVLQQSVTVPAAFRATGLGSIGRSDWGGPADRWVGSIDDARLYQGALTAAEVAALP